MKRFFRKNNSGYSMIVLIITIIVIIIIAGVSLSALNASRERTDMLNYIFDLEAIEDKVKNYYVETGTLPTTSSVPLNIYTVASQTSSPEDFKSQLSQYDSANYYDVDLTQLKGVALKDLNREYIVNDGSLKIYTKQGVEYASKNDGGERKTYFTLTPNLVNGQERYKPLEEDVVVVGNPLTWVDRAEIRIVLPKQSLEQSTWDDWTFRWDMGPKTIEEMEEIPDSDNARNFKYGDKLIIKSNGIYTIYIKNPGDADHAPEVTIKNINVKKIDDISPTYDFKENGSKVFAVDNETGIKEIKFKPLSDYLENVDQAISEAQSGGDIHAESRTKVDYYLMDGKGYDLLYELPTMIVTFIDEVRKIQNDIDSENDSYNRWIVEHPIDNITVMQTEVDFKSNEHRAAIDEFDRKLVELYKEYAYLADPTGATDDSRLVLYFEDYAGNACVVGDNDFICTKTVADAYDISLKPLEGI
jgi:type II secretory pathway pseudopilin PulG